MTYGQGEILGKIGWWLGVIVMVLAAAGGKEAGKNSNRAKV